MKITDKKEIFENIEVGNEIAYYRDGKRQESTLKIGMVTKITFCSSNCDDYCNIKIGIDGRDPVCPVFNNNMTIIKYIKKPEFFKEDEFRIV